MASRHLSRAGLITLAAVALPLTAFAAADPAPKGSDYYKKKICETIKPTGSRLGGVRRCRTKAEIDAARTEDRTVVERIQSMKPTCNTGNGLC